MHEPLQTTSPNWQVFEHTPWVQIWSASHFKLAEPHASWVSSSHIAIALLSALVRLARWYPVAHSIAIHVLSMHLPLFQPAIFAQSLKCEPQWFTSSGSHCSAKMCSFAKHWASRVSSSMHAAAPWLHVVPLWHFLTDFQFPETHW